MSSRRSTPPARVRIPCKPPQHLQAPPPPAAPTNLTATPGDAQVTLTWTASTGATGYNVMRGTTNGGPYTQLAAATSPTYTDSSVTNGTAYYYVVSALSAAGESANSAQASANASGSGRDSGSTDQSHGDARRYASKPHLVREQRRDELQRQACNHQRRPVRANRGVHLNLLYRHRAHRRHDILLRLVSAINSAGESANSAQVVAVPGVTIPPPTVFGTWVNVTPAGVDLTDNLCGNGGTQSVEADPSNPSNLYVQFNCQGIWKSTDFGATWTGPINTGTNAATVSDCVGGITVVPSGASGPGGPGPGRTPPSDYGSDHLSRMHWRHWRRVLEVCLDGGVNWTNYFVAPGGLLRQDYYAPLVDPYNANHLIMAGHAQDSIVESGDGGHGWTAVHLDNGMLTNGRTGFVFFINTGNAATTHGTWLWIGEQNGGLNGTWRTTNSGASWVQVDKNEHPLGAAQIFQPDTSGVLFMAGVRIPPLARVF